MSDLITPEIATCPLCHKPPETYHQHHQEKSEPPEACGCVNLECLLLAKRFLITAWNKAPRAQERTTP